MNVGIFYFFGCPFLDGDCLLPGFDKDLLRRKLSLEPAESAAIYGPQQTLSF